MVSSINDDAPLFHPPEKPLFPNAAACPGQSAKDRVHLQSQPEGTTPRRVQTGSVTPQRGVDNAQHGNVCISRDPWIDEGTFENIPPGAEGICAKARHFGGWLRLRFSGTGSMTATIRLALKE